jgi:hypothetical protein
MGAVFISLAKKPQLQRIMGFDAGFDMVPKLSRTETDHEIWDLFINMVKEEYGSDEGMEIKSN